MLHRRLQQQRACAEAGGPDAAAAHQAAQLRRQRHRPGPQAATLAVPLPITPTPAECAALLKTLVKHLLFQRSQIPYLYDELLRVMRERQQRAEAEAEDAGAERRRRRMPKADRRLLKFLDKTEEALAAIDAALATFGVPPRCFLLLGSSTSKPREAYEVVMPPGAVGPPAHMHQPKEPAPAAAGEGGQQGGVPAGAVPCSSHQQPQQPAPGPGGRPSASRQERLCQLALRQLVVAGAELPEGTAHTVSCKLFVLLEGGTSADTGASSASAGSMGGGPGQHDIVLVGGADEAAAVAPRGFAVKRNFRLSMQKGLHIQLLLGKQPGEAQATAVEEGQRADEGAAMVVAAASASASVACQGCEANAGGGSSSQGDEAPTVHLSQLPDAEPLQAAVPVTDAAAADVTAAEAGPAAVAAAAGPAPGSVWYLCRAAIKGLNSGSQDDGT